jgi:hypothetical protein
MIAAGIVSKIQAFVDAVVVEMAPMMNASHAKHIQHANPTG